MREMGRLEAEQKQLDDQLASGKMDAIKANKLNADLLLLEAKWGRECVFPSSFLSSYFLSRLFPAPLCLPSPGPFFSSHLC